MPSAFISALDVRDERTSWLWDGRVPFGALTIVQGDPGTNKSTFLCDLVARLSAGRRMPFCGDSTAGSHVLLMSAEDSTGRIKANVEAGRADLSRIAIYDRRSDAQALTFPSGIMRLANEIRERAVKMVVIDPLAAFMEGSSDSGPSVRRTLDPLAALAEQNGTAIVLVRHLTKTNSGPALHRGAGSMAILAAARACLHVAKDPANESRRLVAQVKSSLGSPPDTLAFDVSGINGGLRVQWLGKSTCSLEQLLLSSSRDDGPAVKAAMDVLQAVLSEGPVPAREATRICLEGGVKERTLRRACERLGVIWHREGFGRGSYIVWELPPARAEVEDVWPPPLPKGARRRILLDDYRLDN